MLKGIDFQSLGGQIGILMDSKMPTKDKMVMLSMLQSQSSERQKQQQQMAMNQFGAELATMLDTGDDAKVLEEKLPVLIKKYGAKGVPYQTMMQSAQGLINFKNSREKDKREKAAWEEKISEAERKKRGEKAMRMLTQQAPNPALYQPGTFQQLGIGAPSGRPSEAPSKAAPGAPDAAYQNWMQLVRRNSDIPMGDKEKYITSVTGLDPSLQRETSAKALLKQLTGEKPMSPTQQLAQIKLDLRRKQLSGEPLSEPEKQMLGMKDKDYTNMALRLMQSDPTMGLKVMRNPDEVVSGLQTMSGKLQNAMGGGGQPAATDVASMPVGRPFRSPDGKTYVKDKDGTLREVKLKGR
jgi:hypothetical protein